jgi:DNA-binding NarL/FixJ family response regulator
LETGVSVSTVRTHLHNVYRKLGVPDRAQAVLRAAEKGWL